jgi:hypothetical protein
MEIFYNLETFQKNGLPAGKEHDNFCVTYLKRYAYPSEKWGVQEIWCRAFFSKKEDAEEFVTEWENHPETELPHRTSLTLWDTKTPEYKKEMRCTEKR